MWYVLVITMVTVHIENVVPLNALSVVYNLKQERSLLGTKLRLGLKQLNVTFLETNLIAMR